ncbi:hypothetical protein GCM10028791_06770 [Echinicola sediminis]
MGFIPILVTLGGFILLFFLVVNQSIKNKREQYKTALNTLSKNLNMNNSVSPSLKALEERFSTLSEANNTDIKSSKALLGKAKLLRHQYNQLITTKPYSFVAKIAGHSAI